MSAPADEQVRGRGAARDAEHETESAGPARGDTGQGVLDHDRAVGRHGETGGGLEEPVRRRLAPQPEPRDVATVDDLVEQLVDARRAEHRA